MTEPRPPAPAIDSSPGREPPERPDGIRARLKVVRPGPLRHLVLDALVELIISRDLQPGQHLGESELAESLGVSRQPVREALQQLQIEGWVDLRPGQGAFVHVPTQREVGDLLAVRTILEAESARLAAMARTDADIVRLWALWHVGKQAVAADRREDIVTANAELHAKIMEIGGNVVLAELGRIVDRRVRWHYTPVARIRGADAWDEHANLIQAIADGDAAAAERLMRAHAERTRVSVLESQPG
jgi:DNA-binding GntR family transcriptional regulator